MLLREIVFDTETTGMSLLLTISTLFIIRK